MRPEKPEPGTERPITVREGKDILLGKLRSSSGMTRGEQIRLTFLLALPSIFAQLSSCLMSYIDAAMVGALGSAQAAAVGLVSTTTWIFGSFCYANSSGFSVQMAHKCGSKDFAAARAVFRLGIRSVFLFSLALAALGLAISQALPRCSEERSCSGRTLRHTSRSMRRSCPYCRWRTSA